MKRSFLFSLCLFVLCLPVLSQQQNEDYIRWMKEYEKAKARLETWQTIRAMGIGSAVLSFVLYATKKKEVSEYGAYGFLITKKEPNSLYLISGLVGTGISLIGFALAGPASGEVRALEKEGLKKGYITAALVPLRKGIAFSVNISF
jgi:hypothetical protein